MCQRKTSSAFAKAEKKQHSQLLFFLHLYHFFINKEAFGFFWLWNWDSLVTEQRGASYGARWLFKHHENPPENSNSAMQGFSHSSNGLAEILTMSVALWFWWNLRSAQIPLVGLTCRHHQRRCPLKVNRQAENNYWCLLILDVLSVLTYGREGSRRVLSWWVWVRWRGVAPAWPDKPTPSSLTRGVGRAALPLAQQDSVVGGGFGDWPL